MADDIYSLLMDESEPDAAARATAMADMLRRNRGVGGLALLSGDRVLGRFGEALLGQARQQEAALAGAGQQRSGNVLKSALAALEQQTALARAKAEVEQRKADMKWQEGQRELDRASRERAAAIQAGDKAAQREAGGRIPAGEAQLLGQADFALKTLGALENSYAAKIDWTSGAAQFLPGTDAAQYDDERRAAAQMIGTFMEGGKLTDADVGKYMKLLPTAGDGKDRANNKVTTLRRMIQERRTSQLSGLRDAGFNTSRFEGGGPERVGTAGPYPSVDDMPERGPRPASRPQRPAQPAGKVRLKWPNGKIYEVPSDKVAEAKAKYNAQEVR